MPVEVGEIVKGTITGVKKFGAFIKLPDGSTGLCHISEISNKYIKDIETHLTLQQEVDVKIIGVDKGGKINLSIKQTQSDAQPQKSRSYQNKNAQRKFTPSNRKVKTNDFESLITDFIKTSDEKLKTVKSNRTRRGNGFNTKK